jgi:thioesterase domain-containing protein
MEQRSALVEAPVVNPESWAPYVDGNIETIGIASDHHHMMNGKPMADIADMISARLQQR